MPPPPFQPHNAPTSSTSSGTYGKHRLSTVPSSLNSAASNKQRQLSHLNAQLSQLHAHLSDLDELMQITAVQADHIRALGGIHGALLMSATKILGEGGAGAAAAAASVNNPGEDDGRGG
ncbi:DASH complex subunit Hsk3 like-domain-containing protein, partial [Kalaharituber pfeilii]